MLFEKLKGISIERIPFLSQFDNVFFVVNDSKTAKYIFSILEQTQKNTEVIFLEFFDSEVYDSAICENVIFTKRGSGLTKIANSANKIIVSDINSLNYKVPEKEYFLDTFYIAAAQKISMNYFVEILMDFGYIRSEITLEIGQFSVRGGIIDVFPTTSASPFRVDFLGDIIDSIREFDKKSQISKKNIDKISITKNSEIILNEKTKNVFVQKFKYDNLRKKESVENGNLFPGIEWHLSCFHEKTVSILDYLDKNTKFILDFEVEKYNKLLFENAYKKYEILEKKVPKVLDIFFDSLSKIEKEFEFLKIQPFENNKIFQNHKNIHNIRKESDLKKIIENINIKTVFSVTSNGAFNIISDILSNEKINKIDNFSDAKNEVINIIISNIHDGFVSKNLSVYTEKDLFGEVLKFSKKRKPGDFFKEYSRLSVGEYVVHEKHGIAIFEGLVNLEIGGKKHDFLNLLYKNDDRLYVPVENISIISRYGGEDSNVQLDLLKSNSWSNRKKNVRKKLLVIANNLLQLAAKRHLNKVDVCEIPENYDEFCKGFGHIETEDQVSSIEEVLSDLQGAFPMDRLVCGDVGFGKTEVAIRASFVMASNLKQVVLLAPTTILVSQHYKNFVKRFKNFNIKICQISRFVSPKEIKQNMCDIENGKAQIIIATHAILSSSIKFHDLGMIIVDEEQHFGVKQKEFLRNIKEGKTHFMTLSATPIPRTLQLSVSGIKELSMITTPPTDRLSIRTIICDFEKETIKNAIENELKVGGQVFFVTPRVEYLDEIYKFVLKILPEIKVQKVHGKTVNLEDNIRDFCDSKIDVLISTNIIDSGIDIPNANTILIHRFDLFGLSQLYQLRGRVGRSKRQAFAYFLLSNEKILTENAKKRIEVLNSLNKLGSGFNLASYDLDIRGAGNLLGEEQSGYIREVGTELYQSMLQEAILMLKAGGDLEQTEKCDPQINLGLPILIPSYYIEDSNLRLEIYRKIGSLENDSEVCNMEFELSDRFGRIPQETKNLLDLIRIKINCKDIKIDKLDVGTNGFVFSFFENKCENIDGLMKFLQSDVIKKHKGSPKIRSNQKIVITKKWNSVKERTSDIFEILKSLSDFL